MKKTLLVSMAALLVLPSLQGSPQSNANEITDAYNQGQRTALELRRIELEEKKLYLSSIQGSQADAAKAQAVARWVLQNLKDYPRGKKAKHQQEDIALLTETILALGKPPTVSN